MIIFIFYKVKNRLIPIIAIHTYIIIYLNIYVSFVYTSCVGSLYTFLKPPLKMR